MTPLFKNIVLTFEKVTFYWFSSFYESFHWSATACYPSYSWKSKKLIFFAVNNDLQKLIFWKIYTKTTFCDTKPMNLKTGYFTPNSFLFYRLKVHRSRFESFATYWSLFKNNTLKISNGL